MQKPTKEQKKEIRNVLKKYATLGERTGLGDETLRSGYIGGVAGAVLGVPMLVTLDILLTGGVATIASNVLAGACTGVGVVSGFGLQQYVSHRSDIWANAAGQEIKSSRIVKIVLDRMQGNISSAFKAVAEKKKTYEDYQDIVTEIEADVQNLSPAFQIVASGPNKCRMDKYEFVLKRDVPEAQPAKIRTLTDERVEMTRAGQPPSIPAMFKII